MPQPQIFNIAAKAILRSNGKAFVFKSRVKNYEGELVNIWSLPGGKLDENESELEAMVRELKEEIGYELDLSKSTITPAGYYVDLNTQPGKTPICFLHMIVDIYEQFEPMQTEDFIEHKWMDWQEFLELPLHLKGIKLNDLIAS